MAFLRSYGYSHERVVSKQSISRRWATVRCQLAVPQPFGLICFQPRFKVIILLTLTDHQIKQLQSTLAVQDTISGGFGPGYAACAQTGWLVADALSAPYCPCAPCTNHAGTTAPPWATMCT